MEKRMARSEVPIEQTWDLTPIFASDAEWEAACAALATEFPGLAAFRGRFHEGPAIVFECLEESYRVGQLIGRVHNYAFLHLSGDHRSPVWQAAMGRVQGLFAQYQAARAFADPELLQLPEGTLEQYLADEPRLAPWRPNILALLERRAHQLSAETEQALAALTDVLSFPSQIYVRWRSSDLTFDPVTDGQGRELPMGVAAYQRVYERSADTTLRRNAYRSFVSGLSAGKNTIAALWATQARGRAIEAKLRGFTSAAEMLLATQGVPLDLHNRLHDVILDELAPAMRRLVGLRQRQLGLTEVLYCDLEAQLDSEPGPVTSFAEGRRIICSGLSVLGPEYCAIIEAAFRERWIDWAGNEGKTSDSFAGGGMVPHPYVLVNWDDSLRGVNTLAHELGHAAHNYLTGTYNPRGQACYPLLLCEAASTANEVIIGTQLLRGATEARARRCIIEQLLTSYYHNLVRHLMEGELQRRLYPLADAGQPITADLLCRTQEDILGAFWGDSLAIDEGARLTWMRQSHYYMDTLYSYTYSGGISVGTAVARAILREGAAAAERWLTALKAGATLKPIELAAIAGVDLTSPAPLRETIAFVGELVDELIATYEA